MSTLFSLPLSQLLSKQCFFVLGFIHQRMQLYFCVFRYVFPSLTYKNQITDTGKGLQTHPHFNNVKIQVFAFTFSTRKRALSASCCATCFNSTATVKSRPKVKCVCQKVTSITINIVNVHLLRFTGRDNIRMDFIWLSGYFKHIAENALHLLKPK